MLLLKIIPEDDITAQILQDSKTSTCIVPTIVNNVSNALPRRFSVHGGVCHRYILVDLQFYLISSCLTNETGINTGTYRYLDISHGHSGQD